MSAQGVLAVMDECYSQLEAPYHGYLRVDFEEARATVAELIEAMRGLMEGYEARMGDWENADFNDCYRKAEAALARATGDA